VLGSDGTLWVSDEYGPYIYRFSSTGRMLQAIRPPDAYIPCRNKNVSFSSASPPIYDPNAVVDPEDPEPGRGNNQGFEGLTVSHDGKRLYALLQSALNQEGGKSKRTRRHARLIEYDISDAGSPVYAHEYVVPLPMYDNGRKVAGQSDILYITDKQFLILARDSNAGHGAEKSKSLYRQIDVFDISDATDIKSTTYDITTGAIADENGNLASGIVPAKYCQFLDINDNSELAKFKLHNGGTQDKGLLNEKWESISLVPVHPDDRSSDGTDGKEYFMFCLSDNDFVTQNGRMNFGEFQFRDGSGYNLDTQALVFHVTLPK